SGGARVTETESVLDAMLAYAANGLPVFPLHGVRDDGRCTCGDPRCEDVGKHPRLKGAFKTATRDPEVIRDWGRRWPDLNVGIPTGAASNLVVLDIDPRKGGD